MGWGQRWRIDSREKWLRILGALADRMIDFAEHPADLILREPRVEKEGWQRNLFHAVCADIAAHWGLSPGETKRKIKESFYGAEVEIEAGKLTEKEVAEFQRLLRKIGPYEVVVQSSEDSDYDEYNRLTDHAYVMAADSGVRLPDRRLR